MDRATFIETRDKIKGHLYKTGQTTCYAIGDDGDRQKGIAKRYKINTVGGFAGTVNVDSPHYAANTIAFAATTPGTITDSAGLLATVLTGDTIRIRGSALNDAILTVSTGGVAGTIRTTEPTVLEAAGAYITICKRATHSNNTVIDLNSRKKLEWARYVQTGKVGPTSNGKLNWYDAATCFTLHPAAADLQMIASTKTLKIVGGAAEIARYFVGMVIVCSGFAVACNNLPGYIVQSVTVNGADLDLVLGTGLADKTMTGTTANGTMVISGLPSTAGLYIGMAITGTGVGAASVIATIDSATQVTGSVNSTATGTVSVSFRALADEAAAGARTIKIVCQNIYAYAAAANVALLGGYGDWRIPDLFELFGLAIYNAGIQFDTKPDSIAFPVWPIDALNPLWTSTTDPGITTRAMLYGFTNASVNVLIKTGTAYSILVRGG